ncbi:MAG TPA: hypothetical protein VGC04_05275 [Cellulomonas sp.]
MPIFEPDGGRPRLVQPMQPLAGTFLGEVRTLLSGHLPAVVGEPLFVIRTRAAMPEHVDVPELLALDVTGRPVVVEVAQVVDDGAIVDALRHAGAAARLTTADLARAYHPDPTRFSADYAAFRDQVPFARPAELRYGTRLVMLCSEVAAEAVDTLAALRGPGWPVKVLQVGVMRGPDGRRLLDISPLAEYEAARRPAEPTSLRLVQGAQPGNAVPVPVPLDDERPEPPFIPTQPPTMPGRSPVSPAPVNRPASPLTRPNIPMSQPAAPFNRPLAPATRPTSSLAALMSAPARHDPNPTPLSGPAETQPYGGAGQFTSPAPAGFGYVATSAALPELAQLAAAVRAPAPLVWLRVRRAQRLEATLRPDGLIQLADGSLFADPDLAACRAARSEGAVDGWRMWRLGDGGLTLAEVTGR